MKPKRASSGGDTPKKLDATRAIEMLIQELRRLQAVVCEEDFDSIESVIGIVEWRADGGKE